jgi:hypothetical protein
VSVYFITCREAGAVKIGHSVDPYGRFPEIQMGCPLPLKLEALMRGAREEEKAAHWRFSEHRIHGEWFRLAEEIELVIAANSAPHERPGGAPEREFVQRTRAVQQQIRDQRRRDSAARAQSRAVRRIARHLKPWPELADKLNGRGA